MKIQEFLKPFFDSNYNFFKKQAEEHWVDIQKHILDKAHDLELLKVEYNIRLLKELPPEYLEALAGPGPVENLQGNLGGLNDFFKKIAEILQKGPVVREPTPAPAPPSPPPVNPTHHPQPAGPTQPTEEVKKLITFKHKNLGDWKTESLITFTNNNTYEKHKKYLDNMANIYVTQFNAAEAFKRNNSPGTNISDILARRIKLFIHKYQNELQKHFGKHPDYSNRGL